MEKLQASGMQLLGMQQNMGSITVVFWRMQENFAWDSLEQMWTADSAFYTVKSSTIKSNRALITLAG